MHFIAILVVIFAKNIVRLPSRARSIAPLVAHFLDQTLQEAHVVRTTEVTHVRVRRVVQWLNVAQFVVAVLAVVLI